MAIPLGLRGVAHAFHRLGDHPRQRERFHVQPHLARDDPAHVEQVLDELHLRAGVAFDDLHGLRDLRRVGLRVRFLEDARPAEDRVERRAQFVGKRRQELVLEPADALAFQQRLVLGLEHPLALVLGAHAVGHIALDGDPFGEVALPVVQRRDAPFHDVLAAVLAVVDRLAVEALALRQIGAQPLDEAGIGLRSLEGCAGSGRRFRRCRSPSCAVNAPLTYSMRGPGASSCASVMMIASLALSTAALTSAMPPSSESRALGTGAVSALGATGGSESRDIGRSGFEVSTQILPKSPDGCTESFLAGRSSVGQAEPGVP